MDTQMILILFGILIFANLGLTARLFWRMRYRPVTEGVEATPAAAAAVAASVPPATGFAVCAACGHRVARFTRIAKGPVCANCLPLKTD